MKIIGKRLALAATVVALTAAALAPASSASAQTLRPKKWGMVAITVNPSSRSVTPKTVKDVGGGTWSYGTYTASDGEKVCYSNYVHPTKYHSSTAVLAGGSKKRYADAEAWSTASVTAGQVYTCYAYWGTY